MENSQEPFAYLPLFSRQTIVNGFLDWHDIYLSFQHKAWEGEKKFKKRKLIKYRRKVVLLYSDVCAITTALA